MRIVYVGKYIPWLSDHCLISANISFSDESMRTNVDQMKPTDLHPGWVWNDVSRENFKSNLSLPYFKEQFEALENSVNLNPAELAKSIKILLLENTKMSRIKEKRMFKDDGKISEPWFDSECRKKKRT